MAKQLRLIGLALIVLILGVAAACGGDDDATGESDSAQPSAETVTAWQTELQSVGCYGGEVDGDLGPQTEQAISDFQAAAGLTVDGVLGPETESALTEAAAAGETVCDAGSTGQAAAAAASLDSAFVTQDFTVTECSSDGETDLQLTAEVNSFTLAVDASDGSGTIAYSGGDEQDSIDASGEVTSVMVGDDGSFTVRGTWADGQGEFSLGGSCAI